MCELQNEPRARSYEHPADRARHSSQAHNRCNRSFREHIRSCREKIRGPALVCRRRESDQKHRPPFRHHGRKHYRNYDDGTDEHHDFSSLVYTPALIYERSRQPTASDAPYACHCIDDDQRQSDLRQVKMVPFVEKERQPI